VDNQTLPPNCPEAERGVLGCCLLDINKAAVALKAGVISRWFYDLRHAELFSVHSDLALNGGGDTLLATIRLRERGKLDAVGGLARGMERPREGRIRHPERQVFRALKGAGAGQRSSKIGLGWQMGANSEVLRKLPPPQ
jgi:DnaB-like helicase N terminal domain